jgi:hypothetical protein
MPCRRTPGATQRLICDADYSWSQWSLRTELFVTPIATLRRLHKYGAKPKTIDGIRFASTKEAQRYQELKLWEKSGEIRCLRLQPEYTLDAGGTILGVYRADFEYVLIHEGCPGWSRIVEDVKGFKTPLYRWKKKHVEAQYGITIREV